MRKAVAVLFFLFPLCVPAGSGSSTIDPTQPAFGSGLSSSVIRSQFQSAINDINALIKNNSGVSAPTSPALGQIWLNTSISPYLLQQYDGSMWVIIGLINQSSHIFYSISVSKVRQVSSGTSDTVDSAGYPDSTVEWMSSVTSTKTQTIPGCSNSNAGRILRFKDGVNNANIYNINITPQSGTIEGSSSYPINTNRGSAAIQCDGVSDWMVL